VKRLAFIALIFLSGCESCDKANEVFAPESVEGATLHATAVNVTGSFADTMSPGYTFDTALSKNGVFTTTSTNKAADSKGTYTYSRIDGQTAVLKLSDTSALHNGEAIEVTLSFSSTKLGSYSVRVLNGLSGEQTGSFELR
jgi:hypothetical protein